MTNPYNPLQTVDWYSYPSWQTVQTNGYTYYVIPGHEQFVFDPYTGKYYDNPVYLDEAAKKAVGDSGDPGLAGAIVTAAGTIGGTYVASNYESILSSIGEAMGLSAAGTTGAATGATTGALGAAPAATSGSLSTPTIVSATNIGQEIGAAGQAVGPQMFANPNAASGFGSTGALSTGLGALGAAAGTYGMYEGWKKGDPITAGAGAAGLGLGLNAMGYALGPYGWAALGALALASKLNDHESTREVAKRHTKSLLKQGKDDQVWQNYVKGIREQYNKDPVDKSKPFAGGRYSTWDEYKAAGLMAGDLTGVHGNLETFGPEWAHLSQQQREAVTQALIDADLYHSRKGEVNISDKARAREIYAQVLSGQTPNPTQPKTSTIGKSPKQNITKQGEATMNKIPRTIGEAAPLMSGLDPQSQQQMAEVINKFATNRFATTPNLGNKQFNKPILTIPQPTTGAFEVYPGPGLAKPNTTYRSPDGVNTVVTDANGNIAKTTLAGPVNSQQAMPQVWAGAAPGGRPETINPAINQMATPAGAASALYGGGQLPATQKPLLMALANNGAPSGVEQRVTGANIMNFPGALNAMFERRRQEQMRGRG